MKTFDPLAQRAMPVHVPLGARFDYAYAAGVARQATRAALMRHDFKRHDSAWLARFALRLYRRNVTAQLVRP